MKNTILIFALALAISPVANSQNVNGSQHWELIKDHNSDGWVDPGDIIQITLNISVNTQAISELSVENNLADNNLSLVPGTVQSTSGQVILGAHEHDQKIQVENVRFSPPYSKESISFQAEIQEFTELASVISNYSTINSSNGTTDSNVIHIASRGYMQIPVSSFKLSIEWILLFAATGLIVLLITFLRQRVPHLSY